MTVEVGGALPRGDGVALWRKIEAALARELAAIPADAGGRRLPTERELARRFGVNRHTIRQAVGALAARGLVRTEQGRGMFAATPVVEYPLGAGTRFTAGLLAQDRVATHAVLRVGTVPASPACAAALALEPGSLVLERHALGLADGVPLAVGLTRFPAARFPDGAERLRRHASVTAFLATYGLADYRRASTRIQARPATAEEQRLLTQAEGLPVLVTEAVDVDVDGVPVTFTITAWAGERVQLSVGGVGGA